MYHHKGSIITVRPKPAFNLGNDRVLCDPTDFPVLNGGSSNTQFQWSLNGTSISTNRTVTADKSGTYALKAKNSFGVKEQNRSKLQFQVILLYHCHWILFCVKDLY